MTGPTEFTRAHPGQTFERVPCASCGRVSLVPSNQQRHECEQAPSGFKSETDAQAAAGEQ